MFKMRGLGCGVAVLFFFGLYGALQAEAAASVVEQVVKEGVTMEFSMAPVESAKTETIRAGSDALVRFTLTDKATGTPITGLSPAAWMSLHQPEAGDLSCKEKIQSFLQGRLAYRPEVDLNTWYVLALNDKASVTVIDPLLGFGGQKTLALPQLQAPGEDWVVSDDQSQVFITLPQAARVAVLDTLKWEVSAHIEAGPSPGHILFQPDHNYLWVANNTSDKASGVTVIDPETLEVVATIATGAGKHEIAFDAQSRYALVTNAADGTVSVIDVARLKEVKQLASGPHPVAIAYSALSASFYVADQAAGTVVVIDGATHKIRARQKVKPGLRAINFAPGGRWGFIANFSEDQVHILDAANNRIIDSVKVGAGPYQIAFTAALAYIRSAGTDKISTIALDALNKDGTITVNQFTGGTTAPATAKNLETAATIVPTPSGNSVLISNPSDRTIYYYMEGMSAPQGSFLTKGQQPQGALVVNRSLKETAPGSYATTVKPPVGGTYQVALLLSSPPVWHCFTAKIAPGAEPQPPVAGGVELQFLIDTPQVIAGKANTLRFKLTDVKTGEPKTELSDLQVLTFLTPGAWQRRLLARPVGEGVYEIPLRLPKPGSYFVLIKSRSLGAGYQDLPFLTLEAVPPRKEGS